MIRPKQLEFRLENKTLMGFDPETGQDYVISYCGNGSYSHYWVRISDNHDEQLYVYHYSDLYESIRQAELWFVFGVKRSQRIF